MTRNLSRVLSLSAVAVGVFLILVYREQYLDPATMERLNVNAGAEVPLLFIAAYAISAIVFLPGCVLTVAGGVLFGPVLGTFCSLIGATIGAALAFLVSRYLVSGWVERRAGNRLEILKQGVEKEGWKFVSFARLVPLLPCNQLNYAFGRTRISFSHYLITTYVFMLPGTVVYTYLGYAGRETLLGGEGSIQKDMLALVLLAAVVFLPCLISKLRRGPALTAKDLNQQLNAKHELLVLDVRSGTDYSGDLGHIANSRNIPLEDLGSQLYELAPWLEKPITLVCATGRRSRKAARILAGNGFGEVQVVAGGMKQWHLKELPVERA